MNESIADMVARKKREHPGNQPIPERDCEDGMAYADSEPLTLDRLDYLARYGEPSELSKTELRYMAEGYWQTWRRLDLLAWLLEREKGKAATPPSTVVPGVGK